MRIAVLGATGMVGSRVMAEALSRRHEVVAVSRRSGRPRRSSGVEWVSADVRAPGFLQATFTSVEAVVAATRPRPGDEAGSAEITKGVLDTAEGTGTPVLLVGGAGPLRSPRAPGLLVVDDSAYVPAAWREIARASVDQLRVCEEHGADWTYVSPPAVLTPGARTGRYRRGTTTLLTDDAGTSQISTEDLAVAVMDELDDPGRDRHFTVAY